MSVEDLVFPNLPDGYLWAFREGFDDDLDASYGGGQWCVFIKIEKWVPARRTRFFKFTRAGHWTTVRSTVAWASRVDAALQHQLNRWVAEIKHEEKK